MTWTTVALTPGSGADNAPAINAALADPSVSVAYIPAGDWYINAPIIVPSGKWLRGAGMGVARLIGKSTLTPVTGGKAIITIREGSTAATVCYGARVSDITAVAPKIADKVQTFYARNARFFVFENCEAFNAGYAFWAQEYSQYGVFRNCHSHNGNVHFETTRATDILFEDLVSDDGDGDNLNGVEAVWHCLFESKRVTFRNARHTGKGTPFLIVSDTKTATTGDGLIDDIRFEKCRAMNTDGKIGLFMSRFSTNTIGTVYLEDCDCDYIGPSGVPIQVQIGDVRMRGGNWRGKSQDNVMLYPGTTLEWIDPTIFVDSNPAASGAFFSPQAGATVFVDGGFLETTSPIIANRTNAGSLTLTPSTRIVRPGRLGKIYTPTPGKPVRRVFPVDMEHSNAQVFGTPVADEGRTQFVLANGVTYRIRMRGKMKKAATGVRQVGVRINGLGGTMVEGSITLQTAADTVVLYKMNTGGRTVAYDAAIDEAMFDMSMTIIGSGGNLTLEVPLTAAPTIVAAGTEFYAEAIG